MLRISGMTFRGMMIMNKLIPPQMTQKDVEILDAKELFKGFYSIKKYRLRHRLFSGGMSLPFDRELIIRYRVAAALPYDPILNKVVLIEQFRVGALGDENSPWLLEMVAGIMTEEEPLTDLARREAKEEAGVIVKELIPICDYWVSPGGTNERVALFCAIVDASNAGGIHGLPEENEDIKVHVIDAETAFAAVRSGRINNAATIIAVQWLELNQDQIRKQWQ
jgi:ADP-ribose pyrophosphatase